MATPKDDGGVSKAVSNAKNALKKAGTRFGDNPDFAPKPMEKNNVEMAKPKGPSAGILGEAASAAEGLKAKGENIKEYMDSTSIQSVPKMHDGGSVDEDGVKNLQKGEFVLPKKLAKEGEKIMALKGKAKGVMNAAKESMDDEEKSEKVDNKKEEKAEKKPAAKKAAKKAGHDFARTEVIHHTNGSHTTTHHYRPAKAGKDGKMPEQREPVSYGSPDHDSMMSGMDDNLGGGPAGAGAAAPAAPAAEPAPAAL
jgi:hypothetical protein